uniref:Carbonic anhydrase n=1 Tax=Anopheles dirus TaxID=7168 RepID=A0A182N0K7_9DIPT
MQRTRSTGVQSPVWLAQNLAVVADYVTPLQHIGHWDGRGRAILTNDGQSAVLTLSDRSCRPVLAGGLLDGRFLFEQLHFHWGPNDAVGSEHVVDGRRHSMEAHLVHFNARYRTFREALDKRDGLAVVALLLHAHESSNDWPPLEPIVEALARIRRPGTTTTLPADCLRWLRRLEEHDRHHYYTYHGSLTTAPYCESVRWLVYDVPTLVSPRQTAAFRTLLQQATGSAADRFTPIRSNFRPLQVDVPGDLVYVRRSAQSLPRSKL